MRTDIFLDIFRFLILLSEPKIGQVVNESSTPLSKLPETRNTEMTEPIPEMSMPILWIGIWLFMKMDQINP